MKTAAWFAVLLFGATFALAAGPPGEGKGHGGPPEGKGKGHRRPPKEVIEQFDKDGDGKLCPKERHEAMKARHQKVLAKYDKDGDGKLSKEELADVPEPIRERILRHREMVKEFDKDGDGELSEVERKALHEAMRERHRRRQAAGEGKRPKGKGPRKNKDAPAAE